MSFSYLNSHLNFPQLNYRSRIYLLHRFLLWNGMWLSRKQKSLESCPGQSRYGNRGDSGFRYNFGCSPSPPLPQIHQIDGIKIKRRGQKCAGSWEVGPDSHIQGRVPGRGLSPAKDKTLLHVGRQGHRKQRSRFPTREPEAMRRSTGSERVTPGVIPSHGGGKWLRWPHSKCQDTMEDPGTMGAPERRCGEWSRMRSWDIGTKI